MNRSDEERPHRAEDESPSPASPAPDSPDSPGNGGEATMPRKAFSVESLKNHFLLTWIRALLHSLLIPMLVFIAALWWIGETLNPWDLGWIRPDEATEIAEDFLLDQGAEVQNYTTVAAAEFRRAGIWQARNDEWAFSINPAVGYLHRFFRTGIPDSWTIGISPTGQVYRVERQQFDDDAAARLSQSEAIDLALAKLSGELGVPTAGLEIVGDSLVIQPQRHDWRFTFAWPDTFGRGGQVELALSGTAVSGLSFHPDPGHPATLIAPPAKSALDRRVLGFVLILFGVFVAVQQHRTPLAMGTAAIWGGWTFVLTIAVRALTFPQALLLMPTDSPYQGFLARVGLSAVVDALQTGILVGLTVATGEALWRDRLPNVASLSQVLPLVRSKGEAWHRAGRWALLSAAAMLVLESIAVPVVGPVGLISKASGLIASALSSPAPSVALPSVLISSILWDEAVYRLWLIPLLMLLFRSPLAIFIGAIASVYFCGYDLQQMTTISAIAYGIWSLVAGVLAVRFGIYAALLYHLFALGGYVALAMVWTGFASLVGATLLALLFLVIVTISALPKAEPLQSSG